MTFELTPQQLAARDKARAYATQLQGRSAEIDRGGTVPGDVTQEVRALTDGEALTMVVAVEELAVGSAAAAANVAAMNNGRALGLTGLRGAREIEASARGQLVLAAVALGIGKAAVDAALAEVRRSTATPGADVEKPHWVVADVATDLEAARLLTYKAAGTHHDADIALARLMASAAAMRATDAAVRIAGSAALVEGSAIERLARDARAVSVLLGTEEDQRALAADGLLPG